MARHRTFSQYLTGQASLERPCFFYAYSGFWLHLLAGVVLLLLFGPLPAGDALAPLIIGSFSLGVVVYGLLSGEYALLVNLVSYAFSMIRVVSPNTLSFGFLLIAVIIALVSGYFLLSSEYRRYAGEVYDSPGERVPLWITILTGIVVLLLCLYGLSLL